MEITTRVLPGNIISIKGTKSNADYVLNILQFFQCRWSIFRPSSDMRLGILRSDLRWNLDISEQSALPYCYELQSIYFESESSCFHLSGEFGDESLELLGVVDNESGINESDVREKLATLAGGSNIDEYDVLAEFTLLSDIDAYEFLVEYSDPAVDS